MYVAAVVTATRHTGPEPGQCRRACVSSINLLKIGVLVQQHAAAKTILYSYITCSPVVPVKSQKKKNAAHLSRRTLKNLQRNQHENNDLSFVRAQDPWELA